MASTIYDYAIIGAGAAGMHLALAMIGDAWFEDKQVLILEKDDKNVDDRTWSYWEAGNGKWDHLISKSWRKGFFNTVDKKSIPLDLEPYRYKMLHSIDFYNYAKEKIAAAPNFKWIKEEISTTDEGEQLVTIRGQRGAYQAKHIFDSRIDKKFNQKADKYYRILQHFKGWVIHTEKPVFDPDSFVMMDYQIRWRDSTSFTYVLPTSPHRAMIEFTFFNLEFIDYDEYDKKLAEYIEQVLKIEQYTIEKVEYGVIPMSNFPFHEANRDQLTKIGTAGSWVKPSSGYAFKNIEKMAQKVVDNIKQNKSPHTDLIPARFRWCDTLYLDVLSSSNEIGPSIFEMMYTKNPIQQIFKFLDEETSLWEEFKIINSFDPRPFLKAIFFGTTGVRL